MATVSTGRIQYIKSFYLPLKRWRQDRGWPFIKIKILRMTFVRIQKILLALFRNILWTIKWWNLCICFMSGKSGTNSHLPPLQWHTFLSLKTQLFCHFKGPVHHPCLTDLQYVPYMCFTTIFVFQCCAHISMTYMCFMLYMCSNAKCMFNDIQSVSMPYMCFNAVHISNA